MFVYTIQSVVQPVVNRFDNRFDNRLYRVNGLLECRSGLNAIRQIYKHNVIHTLYKQIWFISGLRIVCSPIGLLA